MGFLVPAFLAGALAIGIPLWVHLTNKQKKEAIEFPSLMFLEKIPFRSEKKQVIRNVLLFIMRVAAVVLLVAAFSRPFLGGTVRPPVVLGTSREVAILLDRSYSMGYGDRWSRALSEARGVIEGLGATDRATLILFDERAAATGEPTSDKAVLKAHLETAKLGSRATKYVPALKLAEKVMEESELPKREVVIISDFQRVAWDGHEEVLLPEGTEIKPIDLSEEVTENLAVTSVGIGRDSRDGRDQFTASARITNSGAAPRTGVAVTLSVNGRVVETKRVDLPANNAVNATFSGVAIPAGAIKGTVSLPKDKLSADDQFHFVISSDQEVRVLIVEDDRPVLNQSFFIRGALEIGDRPTFRVDVKGVGQLQPADLDRRALVILNDAPFPGGDMGKRLSEFVSKGGGLFVVVGDQSQAGAWVGEGAAVLPAKIGSLIQRNAGSGAALASLEFGHPIFEVFSTPRSGDFSGARFFSYRPLQPEDSAKVIAHFDDGSVAMVDGRHGEGRVVVLGAELDAHDTHNDLPRHVVFLPFIHELAKHVASFADARPWFNVGEVLDVVRQSQPLHAGAAQRDQTAAVVTAAELVLESPAGEPAGTGTEQAGFIELEEQGFYELRRAGARTNTLPVAVNLNLAESDLSRFEPVELVTSITNAASAKGGRSGADNLTADEREKRQNIWWYLLAVALMLLAAESMLGNRLSPALRGRTS